MGGGLSATSLALLYMDKLKKHFLSFFKQNWQLKDYPISFCRPNPDNVKRGLVDGNSWIASIDGWVAMVGMANTKENAVIELEKCFINYVNSGSKLPRPGTKKELKFASTDGIEAHLDTFDQFCKDILNNDSSSLFVSDESSLWDFTSEDNLDNYYKLILEKYNVDVSNVQDGNILLILKRLENKC